MVTLSLDTHLSLFMVTSLGRSTIRYPTTWVPWTNVISPQRGTKSLTSWSFIIFDTSYALVIVLDGE